MWPWAAVVLLSCWTIRSSAFLWNKQPPLVDATTLKTTSRSTLLKLSVHANIPVEDSNKWRPFLESKGFCNHLFQHTSERKMLKVYSELALRRMELSGCFGELDTLVGTLEIGPRIYEQTKEYIIMEELPGQVLSEEVLSEEVLSPQQKLIHKSIAATLAKLHSATPPSCYNNNVNMLWSSCDVFLNQLSEHHDRQEIHQYYATQLELQHSTLDKLKLKLVLGHGDFKPSNIIIGEQQEAKFVDWETCGNHYRAYDLAKLFRSTDGATENRMLFLQHYCDNEDTPERLFLESKLLIPMTWLEAAMFFHCKSCTNDDGDADMYLNHANDRLACYQESLEEWEENVQEYTIRLSSFQQNR